MKIIYLYSSFFLFFLYIHFRSFYRILLLLFKFFYISYMKKAFVLEGKIYYVCKYAQLRPSPYLQSHIEDMHTYIQTHTIFSISFFKSLTFKVFFSFLYPQFFFVVPFFTSLHSIFTYFISSLQRMVYSTSRYLFFISQYLHCSR